MLLASIVNSVVVSPRQVAALRFDFENATVELDHLYGYTDHDFTVTAAAGIGDEVAAAWSEGPAGRPSSHVAQLTAVVDALDAESTPFGRPADGAHHPGVGRRGTSRGA